MAARHYTVTLKVRQLQLEAGNWVEMESYATAGPHLEQIRDAFYAKYGVKLMNANMSCFEIR